MPEEEKEREEKEEEKKKKWDIEFDSEVNEVTGFLRTFHSIYAQRRAVLGVRIDNLCCRCIFLKTGLNVMPAKAVCACTWTEKKIIKKLFWAIVLLLFVYVSLTMSGWCYEKIRLES